MAGGSHGPVMKELAQRVELADAPFGGGGQVGLDDCEVGEPFESAPAATGGALLDLDGADVALGLVAGKSDGQVGGEPQDHVLVVAEPPCQPPPVLGGFAAPVLVVGDAAATRPAAGSMNEDPGS